MALAILINTNLLAFEKFNPAHSFKIALKNHVTAYIVKRKHKYNHARRKCETEGAELHI